MVPPLECALQGPAIVQKQNMLGARGKFLLGFKKFLNFVGEDFATFF